MELLRSALVISYPARPCTRPRKFQATVNTGRIIRSKWWVGWDSFPTQYHQFSGRQRCGGGCCCCVEETGEISTPWLSTDELDSRRLHVMIHLEMILITRRTIFLPVVGGPYDHQEQPQIRDSSFLSLESFLSLLLAGGVYPITGTFSLLRLVEKGSITLINMGEFQSHYVFFRFCLGTLAK